MRARPRGNISVEDCHLDKFSPINIAMKFIKIYQQNQKDFILINLANVSHVVVNDKSRTCLVHLINKMQITCFPTQVHSLLMQISEYNRQVIEHMTTDEYDEVDF